MLGGMRPPGSPSQLERRRRRALQLRKRGLTTSAIAEQLGCSHSSVVRWHQAYKRNGLPGLAPKPIPGRPPKLAPRQHPRLVRTLLKGPLAAGYATDLWTLDRIAHVIQRQCRVRYHPAHVWKLLRQLGWSSQKPERRALQRNERAIAYWARGVWPHIKKG
jgi:transposase